MPALCWRSQCSDSHCLSLVQFGLTSSHISLTVQSSTIGPPPKDVPPATPVQLPHCRPRLSDPGSRHESLVRLLQSLHRPAELNEAHFAALGVHVHADAPAEEIVPDASFLPPGSEYWEGLTVDQAPAKDAEFRIDLSNGNKSPEARVYLERQNELSTDNQLAFRTVRRLRPTPGVKQPRLGHCYDFFTRLESMAAYWDDTSQPPLPQSETPSETEIKKAALEHVPKPLDASLEQAQLAVAGAGILPVGARESNSRAESQVHEDKSSWRVTYRTAAGSAMPPEHRHWVISAFIKLVSYDFGCNIVAPRTEPRLHLLGPPTTSDPSSHKHCGREPVSSYFNSGCVFLVRTPTKREAARSGMVEGPLAAVSARNTTSFSSPSETNIDFGREIVAALITAQHRAREGKEEKRFGEGKWWATIKRWGGGEGGPIGREIESGGAGLPDDKDKSPVATESSTTTTITNSVSPTSTERLENNNPRSTKENISSSSSRPQSPPKPISPSSRLPMRGAPAAKKQRKGGHMSIYDNYRQVRLPASTWDKKAHYSAIGKIAGADFDDVFVISSLFHHVSILRVRVPAKLLDVFAGAPEEHDGGQSSWGKLEVWRSKWFDLFLPEDRLEALRLLWGVNAWAMRVVDTKTDEERRNTGPKGDLTI